MFPKKVTSNKSYISDGATLLDTDEVSPSKVIHSAVANVSRISNKYMHSSGEGFENDSAPVPSVYMEEDVKSLEELFVIPKIEPSRIHNKESFNPLQEWEGYVTSVDDSSFTAELLDITNPSVDTREEAQFPKEELSDQDLRQLKVGAVFRWSIGYVRSQSGVKRRSSQIIFRNLPMWTKEDFKKTQRLAEDYSSNVPWS